MWGPAIVGFDQYHYRYNSGHQGDWAVTGFSVRKRDISLYLKAPGAGQDALLARLGKYTMGKACLSIHRLADIDTAVLEQLIANSVAEVRRLHG